MSKPKPQLSVRSAKAYEPAREIADAEGRSYPEILEEALQLYVNERRRAAADKVKAYWAGVDAVMAAGRAKLTPGVTSDHSDLHGDDGLPL